MPFRRTPRQGAAPEPEGRALCGGVSLGCVVWALFVRVLTLECVVDFVCPVCVVVDFVCPVGFGLLCWFRLFRLLSSAFVCFRLFVRLRLFGFCFFWCFAEINERAWI